MSWSSCQDQKHDCLFASENGAPATAQHKLEDWAKDWRTSQRPNLSTGWHWCFLSLHAVPYLNKNKKDYATKMVTAMTRKSNNFVFVHQVRTLRKDDETCLYSPDRFLLPGNPPCSEEHFAQKFQSSRFRRLEDPVRAPKTCHQVLNSTWIKL